MKKIGCLPSLRSFSCHQLRNSSVLVKWFLLLNDLGSHDYIWILYFHLYRFQTSSWSFQDKGNGTNPRLWNLFSVDFGIVLSILEVCYSNASLHLLSNYICDTHLEMRISKECPLHFWDPRIPVQILSSLVISFFKWMDFVLGCIDIRLLRPPLPPLLFFEEAGVSRIVEATVSRSTLEDSSFVLTLFESCEPCSWFTTAGLEDSKPTLSKFSSFVRNEEL